VPHTWDPDRYLTYADERGRPFVELMARVGRRGPGVRGRPRLRTRATSRSLLRERWPDADISGLDSSREMIEQAPAAEPSITFEVADLRGWAAAGDPVDVLVSNATLQWVPDHLDLLPSLVGRVRSGGWLAFQVPGTSRSRATRSGATWPPRAPYARAPPGMSPSRAATTRSSTSSALAGLARLHGRRLGDDVPPRPDRAGPRLRLGLGTGARPTLQALTGRPAAGVRGRVPAAAGGRRLPRARRSRRAALPTGLRGRPGPRVPPRDRPPPRPGRLPRLAAREDARRFYRTDGPRG
jgi:trans-aconitate 2-methyltransferase